jgi:hypothetical protein
MSLAIPKSKKAQLNQINKEIMEHIKAKRDTHDKKSPDWLRIHNAMVDQANGYYTHEFSRILQDDLKKASGDNVLKFRKWLDHLKESNKPL